MGENRNKVDRTRTMTSTEIRKILGASQKEWMSLLGRQRMTIYRTEKGATRPSSEYVRFHKAMETVIQDALRNKEKGGKKEAADAALVKELTGLFYEKEALILSLQLKLQQVQRRYQEASQALDVLHALRPEDLPAIKQVKVGQWLNVQKIRNQKKAKGNSPSEQLRLDLAIFAARAVRDEVHRRLVAMGHPPTPVDQLPRHRIRSRRPIK
jgi:DNA-binding XRE family transcriptional regulator